MAENPNPTEPRILILKVLEEYESGLEIESLISEVRRRDKVRDRSFTIQGLRQGIASKEIGSYSQIVSEVDRGKRGKNWRQHGRVAIKYYVKQK